MGAKWSAMYYMSSGVTQNELDIKGINKDALNGADAERKVIKKVTYTQLLEYGEETLA